MALSFGTDGVRGVAQELLDENFVTYLALAASNVLKSDQWILGRDTRESGVALSSAMIAALDHEGIEILDVGVVPTPAIALLSREQNCAGAVISASHNPWTDNGVKIFAPGGRKLHDREQTGIENKLQQLISQPPQEIRSNLSPRLHPKPTDSWAMSLVAALEGRTLEGMRIIIDCANGSASHIAFAIFNEVGAQVALINADPNGRNINEDCGSTHPDGLVKEVLSTGADLGLALDGDADRLIGIASDGSLIDGDIQICLFAKDLADRDRLMHRKAIITPMTNLGARISLEKAAIGTIEVPVGDRNILAELEAGSSNFGGEQSGHVIFHDLATTGDGLLSGLLLADLVKRKGQSSAALASAAMSRYPQVLINVPIDSNASPIIKAIEPKINESKLRLGSAGRVLVRPSGTEALIRVMVEAEKEQTANDEAKRLASFIKSAAD